MVKRGSGCLSLRRFVQSRTAPPHPQRRPPPPPPPKRPPTGTPMGIRRRAENQTSQQRRLLFGCVRALVRASNAPARSPATYQCFLHPSASLRTNAAVDGGSIGPRSRSHARKTGPTARSRETRPPRCVGDSLRVRVAKSSRQSGGARRPDPPFEFEPNRRASRVTVEKIAGIPGGGRRPGRSWRPLPRTPRRRPDAFGVEAQGRRRRSHRVGAQVSRSRYTASRSRCETDRHRRLARGAP
jgi:hypothetical protein